MKSDKNLKEQPVLDLQQKNQFFTPHKSKITISRKSSPNKNQKLDVTLSKTRTPKNNPLYTDSPTPKSKTHMTSFYNKSQKKVQQQPSLQQVQSTQLSLRESTRKITEAYPVHKLGSPIRGKRQFSRYPSPNSSKKLVMSRNREKVQSLISKKLNFDNIPSTKSTYLKDGQKTILKNKQKVKKTQKSGKQIKLDEQNFKQLNISEQLHQIDCPAYQISSRITVSPQKPNQITHEIVIKSKRRVGCLTNFQNKSKQYRTTFEKQNQQVQKGLKKAQSCDLKKYSTERQRTRIASTIVGQRTSGKFELDQCLSKVSAMKKQIIGLRDYLQCKIQGNRSRVGFSTQKRYPATIQMYNKASTFHRNPIQTQDFRQTFEHQFKYY